jgi:alginate O-acetyltransferase complex protein AlgI
MLFNSIHYLVFFPLAVGVYFLLPQRWRWVWLLGSSYYFYMCWRPPYVLVLWALTLVDYVAGIQIARAERPALRRAFLLLSLASNVGLLVFFKYFNFFGESLGGLLALAGVRYRAPELDVILPVGVSFHTFQAMAYTIDVYRRRCAPERHLGYFALYVAYFPQLVAGPIERAQHLLPQLRERHGFDAGRAVDGLRLIAWGFFKKVVIADRLAVYVNAVYGAPAEYGGAQLLLATYFFAFQIYCDFSGYTDIAIGSARVMGVDLSPNFRRPYAARSVADFWRRWHISLSTWFRDFVYIPLGGSRVPRPRHYANLMIVFLLSGLWHGANWTFVLWGALHGSYVVASAATAAARDRAASALGRVGPGAARLRAVAATLVTFHLVAFAWIFFRAATVADAWAVVRGIAAGVDASLLFAPVPGFGTGEVALSIAFLAALEILQRVRSERPAGDLLLARPAWARWALYYAAVLVILLFGRFDEREFIYFQF